MTQKQQFFTSLSFSTVRLLSGHHLGDQPDHIERPDSIDSEDPLEVLQRVGTSLGESALCKTDPSTVDGGVKHSIPLLGNLNGVLDIRLRGHL